MYFVTKLLPMGGGQSLRREWMALLILTAPGMTTNTASVTLSVNFGSDYIINCLTRNKTNNMLRVDLGVKLAKLFTLSMAGWERNG